MDSPGLQTALVQRPPDFLRHIQSLSIHQFWDVNSISTDDSLAQIAQGISRLLLKPATLRRLEIDGGDLLAQKVEGCLQQNGAIQFVYLKDLILSVEFRFLLKLTPKATRVSTSTREGYGMSSVLYSQAEVYDMMAMLKSLQGLRHLELVVSDFLTSAGATIHLRVPTLSLQTLSIVSIRHPNHESNDDEHVPRIPMGLVLEMIESQPTIHKVTIPEADDIDTGVPDRGGWSGIGGCHNWGPAAVIAARFANIKDISVGYFFNAVVRRDSGKGKLFLKRIPAPGCGHEVLELEVKVVTAGDEGWAGHEGDAAWIVFESDGGAEEKPACVVVNADFEAIDEIEESLFPKATTNIQSKGIAIGNSKVEISALWEWYYTEHPELRPVGPARNYPTEPETMEVDPPAPPAQDWPTRWVEFDNGEGAWLYDETVVPFIVAPSEMMQYQDVPMPAFTNHHGPVMGAEYLPKQPTPEPISPLMAQQPYPPAEATPAYPIIDSEPGMPPKARTHPCPLGCGKMFFYPRIATTHAENCSMAEPSTRRPKNIPCPVNAHRGCEQLFFTAGVARKHGKICTQRFPCPNNVDGLNGCTKLFKYEVQAIRHAALCNGKSKAEQERARQEDREAAARRLNMKTS
ncbi:uncharacterized protein J3D65DRAFT_670607 [Phyllosticta citribraziliensis]|uniref:C2H2-type domain-containing protein n=1 Tax=Phyllosticta citribraziliensis TaxID=989973 RepID=A0ABR1L9P3_9PEZI